MKRGGRTGLEKAQERGTSRKHGWNEEWRQSGHLGKRWFWGACTEWLAECIRCHAVKSSQGLSLLNFITGLGRKHRNRMKSWRYSKVKGRERKIELRFELDLWTSMPGTLYSSEFYQWYSLVMAQNCLFYPLLWPHSRANFFFFKLQSLSVFVLLVSLVCDQQSSSWSAQAKPHSLTLLLCHSIKRPRSFYPWFRHMLLYCMECRVSPTLPVLTVAPSLCIVCSWSEAGSITKGHFHAEFLS